jgi:transcriptional regulator of met regulon
MKEQETGSDSPAKEGSAFRKITVTIPQDLYERLIRESARRRIARAPNQMLSALFREALTKYLETLP